MSGIIFVYPHTFVGCSLWRGARSTEHFGDDPETVPVDAGTRYIFTRDSPDDS